MLPVGLYVDRWLFFLPVYHIAMHLKYMNNDSIIHFFNSYVLALKAIGQGRDCGLG